MTRYEQRQVPLDGGFDVAGRVVAVLSQGANTITVLVEVGENEGVPSTFEKVPEGVTHRLAGVEPAEAPTDTPRDENGDPIFDTNEDPTCAGKGGDCSRTVEAWGDYCWQHEPESHDG